MDTFRGLELGQSHQKVIKKSISLGSTNFINNVYLLNMLRIWKVFVVYFFESDVFFFPLNTQEKNARASKYLCNVRHFPVSLEMIGVAIHSHI